MFSWMPTLFFEIVYFLEYIIISEAILLIFNLLSADNKLKNIGILLRRFFGYVIPPSNNLQYQ